MYYILNNKVLGDACCYSDKNDGASDILLQKACHSGM